MFRLVVLFVSLICVGASAADLVGSAQVSETGDTPYVAKNNAFDQARRNIILSVLSPYAENNQLRKLVANSKNSVLTNLISTTSIVGEQFSDVSYSANITMTLDEVSTKQWLDNNGVQNWLGNAGMMDSGVNVVVSMTDKFQDWISLKQISRNENIDFMVKSIYGNRVWLTVPSVKRGTFVSAIRNAGWAYSNQNGVIYINK